MLVVYYAGHGEADGYEMAVLNDTNQPHYPLEMKLRYFADTTDMFVIAVYDCCRMKSTYQNQGWQKREDAQRKKQLAAIKNGESAAYWG